MSAQEHVGHPGNVAMVATARARAILRSIGLPGARTPADAVLPPERAVPGMAVRRGQRADAGRPSGRPSRPLRRSSSSPTSVRAMASFPSATATTSPLGSTK